MAFISLQDSPDEVEFVEPPPPSCGFHSIAAPPLPLGDWGGALSWTPCATLAQPVEPPVDETVERTVGVNLIFL